MTYSLRSQFIKIAVLTALVGSVAFIAKANAVEIDFGQPLLDIENNQIKDCRSDKVNRTDPNNIVCDEWIYHTLGVISSAGLDLPAACPQGQQPLECTMAQSRRAVLARKVHPGKNEKHIVDLSTSEITLILENVGRLTLRSSTEMLRVVEMLDPARLKDGK